MTDSVPRGELEADPFRRYVVRTFRQSFRGYNTDEVDAHLRLVRGWLTLAGFDELVAEHREEILGSALREAAATLEHARHEAQATIEQAQRESEAMLATARRESEAIREEAGRRAQAVTVAVDERLGALKTLALTILEETDSQS